MNEHTYVCLNDFRKAVMIYFTKINFNYFFVSKPIPSYLWFNNINFDTNFDRLSDHCS